MAVSVPVVHSVPAAETSAFLQLTTEAVQNDELVLLAVAVCMATGWNCPAKLTGAVPSWLVGPLSASQDAGTDVFTLVRLQYCTMRFISVERRQKVVRFMLYDDERSSAAVKAKLSKRSKCLRESDAVRMGTK